MQRKPAAVASLLFLSGLTSLTYQTVWLRQFRLIFGASTAATAAVLAVFMTGLGAGSALLGKRADRSERPLAMYGVLELLIAGTAALSPLLLWLGSKLYIAAGGGTLARLFIAALVLGAPTFLMGGTLPAAARAIETDDDRERRRIAVLYAANACGAVAGALLATFYALETFGNRRTLLIAAALNVIVGGVAVMIGRAASIERRAAPEPLASGSPLAATRSLVLAASAITGFVFLLMELVWYRMLAPLLGGTTYTFGLILAAALLGIGCGAALFARHRAPATPGAFAVTCTAEALLLIAPFALGDRLAVLANLLRPLGRIGFYGHVAGWSAFIAVIVLPVALVAGYQFPLLLSLLGSGREDAGRDVGLAYAWNTAGAIAGSLAGGFGLMPALTAPGCWRAAAIALAMTGLFALWSAGRRPAYQPASRRRSMTAIVLGLAALFASFATGPTAVWRHSGIGAGRALLPSNRNELRAWENALRRTKLWDADGRESSIALMNEDDIVFVVNGKSDGSTRGDAPTQVMSGMVGAILHPDPQRALVIGLGTGSTAGWLAAVPSMKRVDVIEIEPMVMRVARDCAAVNRDVLHQKNVSIAIADARETLLTTREHYDLIFSEPSNPYRAGIASLFTTEFYQSAAARLNRGGIFLQWVQAYDVDAQTVATIYATMHDVFPHVETWYTTPGDLILSASLEPVVFEASMIRARLAQEPYRTAMHDAWRREGAEGFLAHYIANDAFASEVAANAKARNDDDRTVIEFGFGRSLGETSGFRLNDMIALAAARRMDHPDVRGPINWDRVGAEKASDAAMTLITSGDARQHHAFAVAYRNATLDAALNTWRQAPFEPLNSAEISELAEAFAEAGDDNALPLVERLSTMEPAEADAIAARLRAVQGNFGQASALLTRSLMRYRNDPWPAYSVMERALDSTFMIARGDRELAPLMMQLLGERFAAGQWNDRRRFNRVVIAGLVTGCSMETVSALHELEPDVPWRRDLLSVRSDCYARSSDPLAAKAAAELRAFDDASPSQLLR